MNSSKHKKNVAVIVWGNQLNITYNSALNAYPQATAIMIESPKMCRKYAYHKQKLRFILSAMREFANELREQGRNVEYIMLENGYEGYYDALASVCKRQAIEKIVAMDSADKKPIIKLREWCENNNFELEVTESTLFLTSKSDFSSWASGRKRLQMEQFYRWQRKRLDMLMDGNKPAGGKWNYDDQNRKPLPVKHSVPVVTYPEPTQNTKDTTATVEKHFSGHPGEIDISWLPTSRLQALGWLDDFVENRLDNFGAYEDAMAHGEVFIYHSALSALLNIGLLHPAEVVEHVMKRDCSLESKEGFIRQIIGWREFMYHLYHYKQSDWVDSNYFGFKKKLEQTWWGLAYDGNEPALSDVLQRLEQYGYSHHIERLMVLGNYMLLSEYNPKEVYSWFMAMYVDAYEWVMVPNVIGMSQYADGGIDNGGFATKPYISGANYLHKMGKWWDNQQSARDSEWTSMYWRFLKNNRSKLENNYRLRLVYVQLDDS